MLNGANYTTDELQIVTKNRSGYGDNSKNSWNLAVSVKNGEANDCGVYQNFTNTGLSMFEI